MPALNQQDVFKKYLETLTNILNDAKSVNDAVAWRGIMMIPSSNKTGTAIKSKDVTLFDVGDQFDDKGDLIPQHKIVFNDKKRVDKERALYFKDKKNLSEWEMIALQSAFFKAGQDTHTYFSKMVTNPTDSNNLQKWLLHSTTEIANHLSDLRFKKPMKDLVINDDVIASLKNLNDDTKIAALIESSSHVHSHEDIKLTDDAVKQHEHKQGNKELTLLIKNLKANCVSITQDTHRKQSKIDLFASILAKLTNLQISETVRLSEASKIIESKLATLDRSHGFLKKKLSTVNLLTNMHNQIEKYYKQHPNLDTAKKQE